MTTFASYDGTRLHYTGAGQQLGLVQLIITANQDQQRLAGK